VQPDNRESVLKELKKIPGVGRKISEDFWEIGISSIQDLKGRDPGELYLELCQNKGYKVDRCMLYVFRCAVYFASTGRHDPELLKWWNWKDRKPEKLK